MPRQRPRIGLVAKNTTLNNLVKGQRKFDNFGYSYIGRSFGVGSSVGLVDYSINRLDTLAYNYTEIGYRTQVDCLLNSTSEWKLFEMGVTTDMTYPNVYQASGRVNGQYEHYAACGLGNSDLIVALIGSSLNGSNVFAITVGKHYGSLDGIQCSVTFTPTKFSISVNVSQGTLLVLPLVSQTPVVDIEPSGKIVANAMRIPTSISQQNACNLYRSVIGDTFRSNIQNVAAAWNTSKNPLRFNSSAINLQGVEDSLTSMVDNTLLAFSSAQLMLANDTYVSPASASVNSIRIGESVYVYIITAINFLVILLYILEVSRTKGWRGLERFDYMDLKDVILATSTGGTTLANTARQANTHRQTRWGRSAEDCFQGKLTVRLRHQSQNLALVYDERQAIQSGKKTKYGDAATPLTFESTTALIDSSHAVIQEGSDAVFPRIATAYTV